MPSLFRGRLKILPTNIPLLHMAMKVPFKAIKQNKSVFYHHKIGGLRAEAFVKKNKGYQRIDELLDTPQGKKLLNAIKQRPWEGVEEIWWELSARLAYKCSGDVHVFGKYSRQNFDQHRNNNLTPYRSEFWNIGTHRYIDTIFEKVELPILENNPNVNTIYYNGKNIEEIYGD